MEFCARHFELLVGIPLLFVVGPLFYPALLGAAATLGCKRHQPVAKVSEPEGAAVVDVFNHLIVIVLNMAVLVIAFMLLEVKLLEHALIEDKGLVVADQEGEEAGEHRGVTTDARQKAGEGGGDPQTANLLLALREVDAEVAVDIVQLVLLGEVGSAQELVVLRHDVHLRGVINVALDEEGKVSEVDEPGVVEADEVLDHSKLHGLGELGHQVRREASVHDHAHLATL